MKLRVLDLFSGIGGFSLGLDRTGGFETVAFCEIEDYPRRVLAKHWPGVPIYDDVRTLTADALARDGIDVDVICGGFPCQDLSFAGKRAGIEGARSGLWREYARLIGEIRPRYVLVENVPGLLNLGMGAVLGDLAALGYDATWDCIPASAVGAPHRRDRVWIIAHTNSNSKHAGPVDAEAQGAPQSVADADDTGSQGRFGGQLPERTREWTSWTGSPSMADAYRCDGNGWGGDVQVGRKRRKSQAAQHDNTRGNEWSVEPDVGRVAARISPELDRGRMNDETGMGSAEGSAARRISDRQSVRGMRGNRAAATASSRLHQTDGRGDPLPSLPCEGGSSSRIAPNEAAKIMQCLRQTVHSEPQQETQHMQPRVPFCCWPHERDEALGIWEREPDIGRVAVGVKKRVDRLKCLGNAVVPQIPELIGRAILQAEGLAA